VTVLSINIAPVCFYFHSGSRRFLLCRVGNLTPSIYNRSQWNNPIVTPHKEREPFMSAITTASSNVVNIVTRGGVVPVVRLADLGQAVELSRALLAGGVTAVELTMTSPGALDALPLLLENVPEFRSGEAALGMGSVLNVDMAEAAIEKGAMFIVSPMLDLPSVAVCVRRGVPVMPGAFTPTEIQTAWTAGAAVVKVFPASAVGPAYFKDVLAPLPHLKLMPTGGVDLSNIADFIRNGAVAVGAGSSLVDKRIIAAADWSELTRRAARFVQAVQNARSEK
jgi:2-dehydro-3-deoxyphosphogluconate aldolase/(4S)-4-hydroxy-2-oxoglutarate aldolase